MGVNDVFRDWRQLATGLNRCTSILVQAASDKQWSDSCSVLKLLCVVCKNHTEWSHYLEDEVPVRQDTSVSCPKLMKDFILWSLHWMLFGEFNYIKWKHTNGLSLHLEALPSDLAGVNIIVDKVASTSNCWQYSCARFMWWRARRDGYFGGCDIA